MPPPSLRFGEVGRRDEAAYLKLILSNLGPFDLLLEMDRRAPDEIGRAFRGGTAFLLGLLRLFHRSPVRFWAARDEDRIVGSTIFALFPGCGYIGAVGTDPAYRKQGIASKLLEMSETEARARGRKWSVLDVEAENLPAVRLYESRGYRLLQRVQWYSLEGAGAPSPTAVPSAVHEIGKPELPSVVEWTAAHLPSPMRDPFPPRPQALSGLELTLFTPWMTRRTLAVSREGRPVQYLRTYNSIPENPAFIFLPAYEADVRPDELSELIRAGREGLRAAGVGREMFPLPDSASAAAPVLRTLGFVPKIETLTLGKPL